MIPASPFISRRVHRYYMHLHVLLTFLLTVLLSVSVRATSQAEHGQQDYKGTFEQQTVMASSASKNVLKGPLAFFSNQPLTGFMRNGYCEVPLSDFGNHSVASTSVPNFPLHQTILTQHTGEVTEEFLDFSAARGNDLRMAGLKGGCKWCLCASRWREAFDARKGDDDKIVPKVFMSATHEKALDKINMDELKKFAAKE